MSRELLKQALYALKYHSIQTRPIDLTDETIEALRQELAKPDPVVLFTDNEEGLCIQLAYDGAYYWQNLSDFDSAKFFVDAYRGRK
jgi:hypothetical protein